MGYAVAYQSPTKKKRRKPTGAGRKKFDATLHHKVRSGLPMLLEFWADGSGMSKFPRSMVAGSLNIYDDNQLQKLIHDGILPQQDSRKHFDARETVMSLQAWERKQSA